MSPLVRRTTLSLLLLSAGVVTAAGQPAVPLRLDPALRPTQYVHTAWQVEDGLPQNSIFTALQTRDGYLWLGTQEGLVRFDGMRFTVFDKAHVEALQSNEIRALLEDRSGALWIGTNGGGLTRYRDGTFTTYTTADGLPSDLVRALYEDRQGHLWIGTIDGGLSRFDGTAFTTYTTADGLPGNVVLAILEDPAGALWIGTENGLSHFHDGTFTRYGETEGLPGTVVWALHLDARGGLWIGTTGGAAYLHDGRLATLTPSDGLCGQMVSAFYEDAAGALWIGTLDGGVCRRFAGRFDVFSTGEGLTHHRVRTLLGDREGSLWIGTEGGGLNQLRPGKFIPFTTAEGLSSDVVLTVLEDRTGAVWIGTEGGGLHRIEEDRIVPVPAGSPSGHTVYALHEGRDGTIWAGTEGDGLCRVRDDRLTCLPNTQGLRGHNVYALYEDRSGILWVGTEEGLHTYRDGRLAPYTADVDLRHSLITALYEDRHGALWVGTYGNGLHRLHAGSLATYTTAEGLSSDIVLVIQEDAERPDVLWIGTQGGGLCRLLTAPGPGERPLVCATTREGLANDNVLQLLDDGSGHLWIGSNKGIARLSKAAFAAFARDPGVPLAPVVYDRADGLKSAEANGGTQPAAWRARDGKLWFATMKGVVRLDPARIPVNRVPPPVVIEEVVVAGRPLPLSGTPELPPGRKDFTFRYTALSFAAPSDVRFRYRLDGYNDDWVEAGPRREAYYTNLPPGTYTFRLEARNADGVRNETGPTFTFRVRPHFYQTPWFLLLATLGLGLLVAGGYQLRVRHLKTRERELVRRVEEQTRALREEKNRTEAALHQTEIARREAEAQRARAEQARAVIEEQAERLRELDELKTRFFNNISHEFRTPLTLIVGPLENLLGRFHGRLDAALEEQLALVLRNARRLLRLINQLLDISRLESGRMTLHARPRNVVSFLEEVVTSFASLARERGIALSFEAARDDLTLYYDADKLEKVCFNLLSNALKFTPAGGQVAVSVTDVAAGDAPPYVEIRVRDTGPGIPPHELPHLFDRFHQVEGIVSSVQEGSGIGLALARELVELHGGTILVESTVGQGTAFIVRLLQGRDHLTPDQIADGDDPPEVEPAFHVEEPREAMPAEADAPERLAAGATGPEGAPTILVVDDNRDIRAYLRSCLLPAYRVAEAVDGADALERLPAVAPDLILCDVMMPRMDGYAFLRHVKESPDFRHLPVILLTAKAATDWKIAGLEHGADDYVAKPFNARELLARIDNLLRLRRQEKELKRLNENLEQQVQEQLELILSERRRYEAELIAARDRAEASSRLKSAILNNMSHEFRTPISGILGITQILEHEVSEEHREFIELIARSGHRLLDTLSAVLDFSQLESDGFVLQPEPVDLTGAAAEALAAFEAAARKKGLTLRLDPPEEPVRGLLDARALQRIFHHVFGNAVKFTDTGEVVARTGRDGSRLYLEVRDTGPGIDPAFMPHLFEPFRQASTGLARTHEGSGLGLAITARLVRLMGGEIRVDSRPGEGTTVTVFLPAAPPTSHPTAPDRAGTGTPDAPAARSSRPAHGHPTP
ncbi:response regulator [Rhodocaloribacter litoris]|uniref:two-component regulator propeller domain-containing protein n=1 Tax=Rhodocaloribacter litoris TaxID=2558931 RepID=UPI0014239A0A|nr:two-component regulator propeller domain-containing protein [Rhodocaloribacter litoris]QXD15837.1 response regulator [Rhodocaloribacter litoris]